MEIQAVEPIQIRVYWVSVDSVVEKITTENYRMDLSRCLLMAMFHFPYFLFGYYLSEFMNDMITKDDDDDGEKKFKLVLQQQTQ